MIANPEQLTTSFIGDVPYPYHLFEYTDCDGDQVQIEVYLDGNITILDPEQDEDFDVGIPPVAASVLRDLLLLVLPLPTGVPA